MGITGLLPLLKKSSREAHLREFKGQTAAVDAYCWLHKGAFSCADKLARGEPTDGYVLYMMKQVNQLLSYDIKPILVFDGCNLPSKAGTETKRRENRERNRIKGKEFLRQGKTREANDCFQKCVDITSEMAATVIEACRAKNIDIIVAPYEADSQLAFLNLQGTADLIITEDSDLVLFGCTKVIFKLNNGGGILVEHEKLHTSMNMPRDKFTFDKFRNMCILSGCDYLSSLHGIGLAKAAKFFTITSNPDIYNALCKLPSYLKMPHLEVTQEYREGFIKAQNTFLYQLVFDPITRELVPLTDYPEGKTAEDYPYAGGFMGHKRALQIAVGNVNVQTGETVNNFDPDTHKAPAQKTTDWSKKNTSKSSWSIWDKSGRNKSSTSIEEKKAFGVPNIDGFNIETTKGKQIEVKLPNLKRKRQSDIQEQQDKNFSDDDLQNVYGASIKKTKSITQEDLGNQYEEKKELKQEYPTDEEFEALYRPEETTSTNLKSCNPFAKCRSPSKSEGLPAKKFSALKRFGQIKKTVIDHNTIVHSRYFSPPGTSSQDSKPKQESESPPETSSLDALSQLLSDDDSQEEKDVKTPDSNSQKSPSQHEVKREQSPFKSEDDSQQSISKEKKSFTWEKLSGFSHEKDKQIKVESSPATKFSFKSHSRISKNIPEVPSKLFTNSPDMTQSKSNSEFLIDSQETSVIDDNIKENLEEIQEDDSKLKEAHNSLSSSQKSGLSSYSNVNSIDNESFNLSQESTKSEYFNSQNLIEKESPKEKFSLQGRKPLQPNVNNKSQKGVIRQPGLSRTTLKKNSNHKQLNLKDMFARKMEPKK